MLAAIVEAEDIEVTDEEIDEALRAAAAGPDASDKQLKRALKRARAAGRRRGAARGHRDAQGRGPLVESAKPIASSRPQAREKLWTPEKESGRVAGDPDAGLIARV